MELGGAGEDPRHPGDHQNRRLKAPENSVHNPPPPHQKCPRCDSNNTKFCYYNNYSLTQPRYFCKACRRYWTHGGTLRNIPVGGGCRKGKRTKSSSLSGPGECSRSYHSSPPPPPPQQIQFPNIVSSGNSNLPGNQGLRNLPTEIPSFYSGGGFLSSLATMQLSQPPQRYDPLLNLGSQYGVGPANLALLQGVNLSSWRSQQAQPQQIQYPSSDQNLVQANRPMVSWTPSFMNTTNPSGSNPSFWNSSTRNTMSSSNANATGPSMNPNQWTDDLPGYGSP